MGMTRFPHGVSSFGMPVFGSGGLIPCPGQVFFVDQANGLDSNLGTDPGSALKTLSKAHSKMTANQNDTVIVMGSNSTIAVYESETLAWTKDMCHIIGVAYNRVAHRVSIRAASGETFTPLVSNTADGCVFANFMVYHGYTDASAQIAWNEAGERNAFFNIHFAGMADATAAAQAGGRSLKLAGGGERLWKDCTIGLDTVDRSTTANAEFEIAGSVRDRMENCTFRTYGSGAHAMAILTATGLDRDFIMKDCEFINGLQSGTGALNEAFSCTASTSPGGAVVLVNPCSYGCGPWEADAETGRVIVLGHVSTNGTDNTNIGIAGVAESP